MTDPPSTTSSRAPSLEGEARRRIRRGYADWLRQRRQDAARSTSGKAPSTRPAASQRPQIAGFPTASGVAATKKKFTNENRELEALLARIEALESEHHAVAGHGLPARVLQGRVRGDYSFVGSAREAALSTSCWWFTNGRDELGSQTPDPTQALVRLGRETGCVCVSGAAEKRARGEAAAAQPTMSGVQAVGPAGVAGLDRNRLPAFAYVAPFLCSSRGLRRRSRRPCEGPPHRD